MTTLTGFRLVKQKFISSAFDGEGAKRYGGRWNSRGVPCVYLAASQSLALLEVMVHLQDYQVLKHYRMLQLQLSEPEVLQLAQAQLPANWRDEPAPVETAAIGDGWLRSGDSLALAVPSVVIPGELNYLLNVEYSGFDRVVETAQLIEFEPDRRLLT